MEQTGIDANRKRGSITFTADAWKPAAPRRIRGPLTPCGAGGVAGWYIAKGAETVAEPLPLEFFRVELETLDASDPESVGAFMAAWGLAYVPARLLGAVSPFDAFADLETETALRRGCEATRQLCAALLAETEPGAVLGLCECAPSEGAAVVSFAESSAVLTLMQDCVRSLLDDAANPYRAERHEQAAAIVDACAGASLAFLDDTGPRGLVPAIARQVLETFADSEQWRTCARCGRVFKHQVDKAHRGADDARARIHGDSPYCTKQCANAAKVAAFRARARAAKITETRR